MDIPEIVKQYVLKIQGRMPETQDEIDEYLDLILHMKEYERAFEIEQYMSKRLMKRLGIKTTYEIKKEGKSYFNKNI